MIKYQHALDNEENLIHIKKAERKCWYTCFLCKKNMQAKKGDIIQPYFAHQAKQSSCSETELHKRFKYLVFRYLCNYLNEKQSFQVAVLCDCRRIHHFNLLEKIMAIKTEKQVRLNDKRIQPDVSLHFKNKIIWGIEIVVTSDIKIPTAEFYNINKIGCIRIIVNKSNFLDLVSRIRDKNEMSNEFIDIRTIPGRMNRKHKYKSIATNPFNYKNNELERIVATNLCNLKIPMIRYSILPNGLQLYPCYDFQNNQINDFKIPCNTCKHKVNTNPKNKTIECKHPDLIHSRLLTSKSRYLDMGVSFYYNSGRRFSQELSMKEFKQKLKQFQTLVWFNIYNFGSDFKSSKKKYLATYNAVSNKWMVRDDKIEKFDRIVGLIFDFGKYLDKRVVEIIKSDPEYIAYLLRRSFVTDFDNRYNWDFQDKTDTIRDLLNNLNELIPNIKYARTINQTFEDNIIKLVNLKITKEYVKKKRIEVWDKRRKEKERNESFYRNRFLVKPANINSQKSTPHKEFRKNLDRNISMKEAYRLLAKYRKK